MAKQYVVTGSSTASGGGSVTSVFARAGAVVAVLGDYAASLVTNNSSVTGATVKDALNTLLADFGAISYPVTSVFARTGAIVATLADYAASLVTNDSSVSGATVKDALNALLAVSGVTSVFGRTGAVVAVGGDYDEFQVGVPLDITTAKTITNGRGIIVPSGVTIETGGSISAPAGTSMTVLGGLPDLIPYIPDEADVLGMDGLLAYFDGDHVTLTSGKVSSWTDRSGRGNHAVQATAGARPVVLSTVINGLSTLSFSGAQCLQIPSLRLTTFDIIGVVRNAPDASQILYEHSADTNSNPGSFILAQSSGGFGVRRGTGGGATASRKIWTDAGSGNGLWNANDDPFMFVHHMGGTHVKHYGILRGSGAHDIKILGLGASGLTADPGTSAAVQAFNIGSRNQASLFYVGELATMLIFSPCLSTGQLAAVQRMVARKYDVYCAQ